MTNPYNRKHQIQITCSEEVSQTFQSPGFESVDHV